MSAVLRLRLESSAFKESSSAMQQRHASHVEIGNRGMQSYALGMGAFHAADTVVNQFTAPELVLRCCTNGPVAIKAALQR